MNIRHLFLNILNILIFFSVFYIIFNINYIVRTDELFGSQIFLTDIVAPNATNALIQFTTFIIGSIFFVILFNKVIVKYKNLFSNFSKNNILVIIFCVTFFLKLMIFGFNLGAIDDAGEMIDRIFVNGEFNEYKLFNYLAYIIYSLTDNYSFYLFIINIIFGSLTICVLYLIFSRFLEKDSSLFLILFLSALCIPLTAIESIARVDAMYMILLTSTFYYLIKIIQDDDQKDFIKLLIILGLSCFCRESTLYMLPLFAFILLFSNKNKTKYILISSILVVTISILISSENLKNYGVKSKFKEFHLIIHAMHYGYLNENHMQIYKDTLSSNGKILLKDLNKSYKTFVPPHKREIFNTSYLSNSNWNLVRPDNENIYKKPTKTLYKGNLEIVIKDYITLLKNQPGNLSRDKLSILMSEESLKYKKIDDRNLSEYLKNLIFEIFLAEENKLIGSEGLCFNDTDNKLNIKYQTSCVINILKNIDSQWMQNRSDNWSYYQASMGFVWNFDKEKRKYIQHEHIQNITEIILKIPMLYITQSLLTLTAMSGQHPTPSGLVQSAGIYKTSILPNFILKNFQQLYTFIVNFWYVFCGLVFFHSLFNRKINSRVLKIIISLTPIYYGLFICFAAQGEFARLMLPVVPMIIYNYLIVINILHDSLKKIISFFFQSKKLSQI